jgi:hypothetical protein
VAFASRAGAEAGVTVITGQNVLGVPPPKDFTFEIDVDIELKRRHYETSMVAPEPVVQEEVRPQQEPPKEAQQEAVAPNWNWWLGSTRATYVSFFILLTI